MVDGQVMIVFVKGVVEEVGQDVFFFVQVVEMFEEVFLWCMMDDEVGFGNQQLGGNLDCLCVCYYLFGSFVEVEQDVY